MKELTKGKIMKRIFMSTLLIATCMGLAGTAVAADGAAIYKSKCAMCHGADGQGTPMGNALKGNKFISSGSDKAITELILKGRSGAAKKYKQFPMAMPPQKLGDGDVSALISYLKSVASK
jgi:mono/diheme cytochrome c family protein